VKTLHLSIIVVLFFAFFFGLHFIENFKVFGNAWVSDKYNNTMRISIQSSPTHLNLQPPQGRQIHLKFFDASTNKPIENVVFGMNVTKENQIFLYNTFYTKSGSFTLNLKPAERNLWSASPDHDPMDGLYYSQGDQIDIDTSYLTEDLYHFEFHPMIWVLGDASQENDGIRFGTTLNLLETYNQTITPDVIVPEFSSVTTLVTGNQTTNQSSLQQQIDLAKQKTEEECIGGPGMCPAEQKLIKEKENIQTLILVLAIGIPAIAASVIFLMWRNTKQSRK